MDEGLNNFWVMKENPFTGKKDVNGENQNSVRRGFCLRDGRSFFLTFVK